ncbi:hypothetical protein L0Y69_01615 [bacterium]|nr:hypothetical protein [bacterium]
MPDILKIFIPFATAFFLGIAMTPILTHYLYKYKMWKKKSVQKAFGGGEAPISQSLHRDEEKHVPRMGGVVIWSSTLLTVLLFSFLGALFPDSPFQKYSFFSREQTWLPLFALVVGSLIGLIDDFLEVRGSGGHIAGGLSLKKRLAVVFLVGSVGAWWFYFKLGISLLAIPFAGAINLGLLFIPFFILVMLALYAGGVIDGLDGLAGGCLASAFFAYTVIAYSEGLFDLSALCAVIVASLLAFLWFNIPPARFYMSETGTMGLTITLAVVAFLTDAHAEGRGVLVLPIIAFPLFITVLSDVLQILSKKMRNGKKIFLVAPLHHHFEAIGWPSYKVTMRYWILSVVFAVMGVAISLFGQ